jgi:hypothetical protein
LHNVIDSDLQIYTSSAQEEVTAPKPLESFTIMKTEESAKSKPTKKNPSSQTKPKNMRSIFYFAMKARSFVKNLQRKYLNLSSTISSSPKMLPV